eukprot:2389626-Rhodomonas_salina.1
MQAGRNYHQHQGHGTGPLLVGSPLFLRACYAMSGIDMTYSAICLRACCAMSGTDFAHAAVLPIPVPARYVMTTLTYSVLPGWRLSAA